MGFYNRYILPHAIDCACGGGHVMKARSKIVPRAYGNVLELGIGSGLNLAFYDPQRVQTIFGVDPSAAMQRKAQQRAAAISIPVEMVPLEVEQIGADDAHFDSAVCTFTLCTIPDPVSALRELARVLKPDGELFFCEHGRAPDVHIQRWQNRLQPFWKPLAGGCHINRDIPAILEAGGFDITEIDTGYIPGPKPMAYLYAGVAVASAQRAS